jgi:hypothetical protein
MAVTNGITNVVSTASGPLKGAVALVTGAGRGIGAGIAKELALKGASVVVSYANSLVLAKELVKEIEALGSKAGNPSRRDQTGRNRHPLRPSARALRPARHRPLELRQGEISAPSENDYRGFQRGLRHQHPGRSSSLPKLRTSTFR